MLGLDTTQATRHVDTEDAFACLECSLYGDTKAVVGCAASASDAQTVRARCRCIRHSRLQFDGTCPAERGTVVTRQINLTFRSSERAEAAGARTVALSIGYRADV
jgi:hypothetical protein